MGFLLGNQRPGYYQAPYPYHGEHYPYGVQEGAYHGHGGYSGYANYGGGLTGYDTNQYPAMPSTHPFMQFQTPTMQAQAAPDISQHYLNQPYFQQPLTGYYQEPIYQEANRYPHQEVCNYSQALLSHEPTCYPYHETTGYSHQQSTPFIYEREENEPKEG
jgi:hypothetical protein